MLKNTYFSFKIVLQKMLRFLSWVAVVGYGSVILLGFGGRTAWQLDALSNFRLQYAVAGLPLLLLLLLLRQRRAVLVWVCVWGVNAAVLTPYLLPTAQASPAETSQLRLLMANVYYLNQTPEKLTAYVAETQPDVIVLVEMNWRNKQLLESLYAQYPYQIDGPGMEVVLLSQRPLTTADMIDNGIYRDSPSGRFDLDGQSLTVLGVHAPTPLGEKAMARRNDHLNDMARRAAAVDGAVVMVGDLNLSSFSPNFAHLESLSGLQDARYGFGIWPSWPEHYPLLRIPIDHVLVSPEVTVSHFELGPMIGSDHFPVLVELEISPQ